WRRGDRRVGVRATRRRVTPDQRDFQSRLSGRAGWHAADRRAVRRRQFADGPDVRPGQSADSLLMRFSNNRGAVVGLVIISVYVCMALFADVLAPYSPVNGQLAEKLQPPSPSHLLGTDELGRDLLSRLLFGARSSIEIQLSAVAFALVIGVAWGLVAGYFG